MMNRQLRMGLLRTTSTDHRHTAAKIVERHVRLYLGLHLSGIKLGELRPTHVSSIALAHRSGRFPEERFAGGVPLATGRTSDAKWIR
jgi:hypothetical protein